MSITTTKPEKQTRIRAMIIGALLLAVFLSLWQLTVTAGWLTELAPTPARTATRAIEIFSDPFYYHGTTSVGIFWHLITSLRRVLIGFTIATLIAVPVGFLLGRSTALRWAVYRPWRGCRWGLRYCRVRNARRFLSLYYRLCGRPW